MENRALGDKLDVYFKRVHMKPKSGMEQSPWLGSPNLPMLSKLRKNGASRELICAAKTVTFVI